jgi:hypothetical protein
MGLQATSESGTHSGSLGSDVLCLTLMSLLQLSFLLPQLEFFRFDDS